MIDDHSRYDRHHDRHYGNENYRDEKHDPDTRSDDVHNQDQGFTQVTFRNNKSGSKSIGGGAELVAGSGVTGTRRTSSDIMMAWPS